MIVNIIEVSMYAALYYLRVHSPSVEILYNAFMKKKTDTPEEMEELKKKSDEPWYHPNMTISTILLILMIGLLVYGFISSPRPF